MRDYREKLVNGWLTDGEHFGGIPVRVRMASDDRGQLLSLTTEMNEDDMGLQIGIPLEDVRSIIRVPNASFVDAIKKEKNKVNAEGELVYSASEIKAFTKCIEIYLGGKYE